MVSMQSWNVKSIHIRRKNSLCSGKLISIRGCIMRAGTVKQFPQWFEFRCKSCSTTKLQRQVDGLYTLPTKCKACNSKRFRPILDSLHTKTVNFQTIRLQEHFGDEQVHIHSLIYRTRRMNLSDHPRRYNELINIFAVR